MTDVKPMKDNAPVSATVSTTGRDEERRDNGGDPQGEATGSSDLLQTAVRRVRAEWTEGQERSGDDEGVRSQLAEVVDLIEVVRSRGSDADVGGTATALRLRLLDGIRRELLAGEDREPAEKEALLELLRSLEETRKKLEADWARRFGLALSGPDGVEVAAEIAHGLRSSCTSILFVSEVLRDGIYGELNEKQRKQVDVLYGAAVSLASSLSDITELSWRTREPGDGKPEVFSLEELTDSVLQLLEPVAAARNSSIAFELQAGDLRRGHPRALNTALLNLVLDAVLHATGARVAVEIHEGDGEETVAFRIRVTGGDDGEPEDEDPFRILREAVDDDYSFSVGGLRLHMARHLVLALGSELHHEFEDGRLHTGFSLTLPTVTDADEGD